MAQPNRESLAAWLGKQMAESPAARMEDPVEDVFVGCINSEFGSFRVFAGVFADGDFWIERLLAFLAEKQNFPPFEMAIKSVLPLLRIGEALAERTGLTRYCPGGGSSFDKMQIPQWRKILACAQAVHFSAAELAAMGIDAELLREFTLTDQRRSPRHASVGAWLGRSATSFGPCSPSFGIAPSPVANSQPKRHHQPGDRRLDRRIQSTHPLQRMDLNGVAAVASSALGGR